MMHARIQGRIQGGGRGGVWGLQPPLLSKIQNTFIFLTAKNLTLHTAARIALARDKMYSISINK